MREMRWDLFLLELVRKSDDIQAALLAIIE
jgi:hypothetical protein